MRISSTPAWKALNDHSMSMHAQRLKDLLSDQSRCSELTLEFDNIVVDCSRQLVTSRTMALLRDLANAAGLAASLKAMAAGEKINRTEHRAVLHTALRAPRGRTLMLDGVDVIAEVHAVQDRIRAFSDRVRKGGWLGATGKPLTDVVSIGIGGSYLGPDFVAEALRTDQGCLRAAEGRRLRFLANVDPVDVHRAIDGLDPATTMVVVVSKTFTTAETMLNAKLLRSWLVDRLGPEAVARHMVAVSTNLPEVAAFGIDPANVFGFWDWVGGRYSVCSAVGLLPLALQYGFGPLESFLSGARSIDQHVFTAPFERNIPVTLGLLGVWNHTILGHPTRALLPYSQALLRFSAHIQQVDMESNGKRVAMDGTVLPFPTGPVDFGEPGTNGQHSFYQLLHQGRVVPADFVGFIASQQPRTLAGEPISSQDELMANFFAQPDALAIGKTADACRTEGVPEDLIPHKVFPGDRPSSVLLFSRLDPYTCGQLLAIYEHRTAVEGFIWGLNSFDQWGVELGKVLAKQVRAQMVRSRGGDMRITGFNPSTTALLTRYLGGR